MNWPTHIFLDREREELYVANDAGDSILIFRETDHGDVVPARVLTERNFIGTRRQIA